MAFMAAEFLFKKRFLGWIMQQSGCIPVKPGLNKETLKDAVRILNSGYSLGIFPEGKITDDGRMTEGKKGVAVLSQMTQAKIIPLAIEGTFEV